MHRCADAPRPAAGGTAREGRIEQTLSPVQLARSSVLDTAGEGRVKPVLLLGGQPAMVQPTARRVVAHSFSFCAVADGGK